MDLENMKPFNFSRPSTKDFVWQAYDLCQQERCAVMEDFPFFTAMFSFFRLMFLVFTGKYSTTSARGSYDFRAQVV